MHPPWALTDPVQVSEGGWAAILLPGTALSSTAFIVLFGGWFCRPHHKGLVNQYVWMMLDACVLSLARQPSGRFLL